MTFKRSGKTIFGVTLTPAEQKILDREIEKQLSERMRQYNLEVEAKVLWGLREVFGFGETRLRRYYDNLDLKLDNLADHYEMGDEDLFWLCTKQLKDIGIDIEEWSKENELRWREHSQ